MRNQRSFSTISKLILFSFLVGISFEISAQNLPIFKCIDPITSPEELEQYKKTMERNQEALSKWQKEKADGTRAALDVTIPVHVIIIHDPIYKYGEGNNFSDCHIQEQIDILNHAFAGTNENSNETPSDFEVGRSGIKFKIADFDLSGNPTNGITRVASNDFSYENDAEFLAEYAWRREWYINLFVAEDLDERLGYASRPTLDSLPDVTIDAVRVASYAFGIPEVDNFSGYDKGAITVHEFGHYLGLIHLWGPGISNYNCSTDDGILDTPPQKAPNHNCPTHPHKTCGNLGDMFMNYMDYTVDACKTMFSPGQVDFMDLITYQQRPNLLTAANTACLPDNIPVIRVKSKLCEVCLDSSDGMIEVTAKYGTAPYRFSLDDGPEQGSGIFSNLPKGTYNIKVIDSNNQSSSTNVDVEGNEQLDFDIQVLSGSCSLENEGSIQISTTNENIGFVDFYLSNDEVNLSANNKEVFADFEDGLPQNWGNQTYWNLRDSTSGSSTFFTIPNSSQFMVWNDDLYGFDHMSSGGVYSNVIDLGDDNDDDFSVSFDAYFLNGDFFIDETAKLLISGDNGNSYQEIIDLPRHKAWRNYRFNFTDFGSDRIILRFEYNDGGGLNYGFAFDNVAVINRKPIVFDNLNPGTYNLQMVDANGCSLEQTIVIPQSTEIQVNNINIIQDDCSSPATVQVDATSVNGISGFQLGSESNTNGVFENLTSGMYELIITDNSGCNYSEQIEIISGDLDINFTNIAAPTCIGADDGIIDFTIGNATGTTSISVNGTPFTSTSIGNLASGTYLIEISDEAGCNADLTINIPEATEVALSGSVVNAKCFEPGSISLNVIGGLPPYSFMINSGELTIDDNPSLTAGQYDITAFDANGCPSQELSFEIQNEEVSYSIVMIESECSAGATPTYLVQFCTDDNSEINWMIEGDQNFSVAESDMNSCASFDLSSQLSLDNIDLSFNVTGTDSEGCSVSQEFSIDNPTELSINADNEVFVCPEQQFELEILNQSEFAIILVVDQNNVELVESNPNQYLLNPNQTYTINTVDNNGCTNFQQIVSLQYDGINVEILSISDASGNNNGSIDMMASGGTAPFTFTILEQSNSTGEFENLPPGNYDALITDINGCEEILTFEIGLQSSTENLPLENDFFLFPNPTEHTIAVKSKLDTPLKLEGIYNTNSQLVTKLEIEKQTNTIDVQELKSGVYFIKIRNGKIWQYLRFIKI